MCTHLGICCRLCRYELVTTSRSRSAIGSDAALLQLLTLASAHVCHLLVLPLLAVTSGTHEITCSNANGWGPAPFAVTVMAYAGRPGCHDSPSANTTVSVTPKSNVLMSGPTSRSLCSDTPFALFTYSVRDLGGNRSLALTLPTGCSATPMTGEGTSRDIRGCSSASAVGPRWHLRCE